MNHWEEFRTAYVVCQVGTINKAAKVLGVHRASVIRHISILEEHLKVPLFRRHARGYSMTDAGKDLLRTGQRVNGLFDALLLRVTAESAVEGPLRINTLGLWSTTLIRAAARYKETSPHARVELCISSENSKLENLEADIALLSGSKPDHPDYVVLPFATIRIGLYVHSRYVERYGIPAGPDEYACHRFLGPPHGLSDTSYWAWLQGHIPASAVCLASTDSASTTEALEQGIGIGFYPAEFAAHNADLIELNTQESPWLSTFWMVTHGDLHRSTKIQRFLACLREDGYLRPRLHAPLHRGKEKTSASNKQTISRP